MMTSMTVNVELYKSLIRSNIIVAVLFHNLFKFYKSLDRFIDAFVKRTGSLAREWRDIGPRRSLGDATRRDTTRRTQRLYY